MDERKHKRVSYATNKSYMLSGLMKCGYCGRAICGCARTNSSGYSEYRCNKRSGEKCNLKATRTMYVDDYVLNLFNNCLFRQENTDNIYELIKICYMSTHEELQNERDRIRQKITELEEIVESNCGKITEDSMKTMRKYLEEQNAELRWEISELSHKLSLVEEQISHYPTLRKMVISKNILAYKKLLQSTDKNELRNVLFELVHHIVMDNENVSITFNFHRLLSGHEPILATVIEKRQNIAQLIHHRCQKLTFSELHIRI